MKNKNKLNTLRRDYYKAIRKARLIGLSGNAFRVLHELMDCAESFNPSTSLIEKNTGFSRATIARAMKELIEHNVVKVTSKGRLGQSSRYEFVEPIHWTGATFKAKSTERNRLMEKGKFKSDRKALALMRLNKPDDLIIDFIVPIVDDNVCGLNVSWNMIYVKPKR